MPARPHPWAARSCASRPTSPSWLSTLYSTPPLTCNDQLGHSGRLKLRMLSPRFSSTRELAPGMSITWKSPLPSSTSKVLVASMKL